MKEEHLSGTRHSLQEKIGVLRLIAAMQMSSGLLQQE